MQRQKEHETSGLRVFSQISKSKVVAPSERNSDKTLVTEFKGMIIKMFKQFVKGTNVFQESTNKQLTR